MTKAELIRALEPFADDAQIVVEGFDGAGFDDPVVSEVAMVEDNDDRGFWKWWPANDDHPRSQGKVAVKAVLIGS